MSFQPNKLSSSARQTKAGSGVSTYGKAPHTHMHEPMVQTRSSATRALSGVGRSGQYHKSPQKPGNAGRKG